MYLAILGYFGSFLFFFKQIHFLRNYFPVNSNKYSFTVWRPSYGTTASYVLCYSAYYGNLKNYGNENENECEPARYGAGQSTVMSIITTGFRTVLNKM